MLQRFYNNYYDIYKNDYGSKDKLSEAKKKKFGYKNSLKSLAGRIIS